MEWITTRTGKVKCEYLSNWHHWFAWYPVAVIIYPDGAEKKVWLKTVLRRAIYIHRATSFIIYEYKETR
jgi:hypothetical protein